MLAETIGSIANLKDIMQTQHSSIDLTQRPPRSFRVCLGNFVILARMLDKVDELGGERDRLVREQRIYYAGTDKFIRGTPAAKRGL